MTHRTKITGSLALYMYEVFARFFPSVVRLHGALEQPMPHLGAYADTVVRLLLGELPVVVDHVLVDPC